MVALPGAQQGHASMPCFVSRHCRSCWKICCLVRSTTWSAISSEWGRVKDLYKSSVEATMNVSNCFNIFSMIEGRKVMKSTRSRIGMDSCRLHCFQAGAVMSRLPIFVLSAAQHLHQIEDSSSGVLVVCICDS